MDDQNKNLILASALSFAVILIWFVLFPPPEAPVTPDAAPAATAQVDGAAPITGTAATAPSTAAPAASAQAADLDFANAPRVAIETPRVKGSLSLLGGYIDELALKDYRDTLDTGSEIVSLLTPRGQDGAYYAFFGWATGQNLAAEDVPGAKTLWSLENGDTLTESTPITIAWTNAKGLTFRVTLSIDEDYMFSAAQSVTNDSGESVALSPYGMLVRHGLPDNLKKFFILHEGLVAMADGTLTEASYKDFSDFPADNNYVGVYNEVTQVSESGWTGFTDHYWMTTLIPAVDGPFSTAAIYSQASDIYQTQAVLPRLEVGAGATATSAMKLFAGAKEWETIRSYQNSDGVTKFLDSIDWGWFFFLTKPIFAVLHWLNGVLGNMGIAIIALTLLLKALLFPLAYKSYASMAKMKELQPQLEKLKKDAGDDKAKLQQEMMALYKKEKVNPAAGCLPILMQIPIFFSLYKVIFVTLELRHAPFYGWIRDLSAPDPSSILNLFGLLPFAAPAPESLLAIISLGVLPILLGISMWVQQKLNPAPTDPVQAQIFGWMPWVFMFMLGGFASGLVIYWIANNTITFTQQYLIMRHHGYKPDVFGNIKQSFSRKKPEVK
ncbi:MAG: membrane protein insertase YidC [Paracoccaceae bacterium]